MVNRLNEFFEDEEKNEKTEKTEEYHSIDEEFCVSGNKEEHEQAVESVFAKIENDTLFPSHAKDATIKEANRHRGEEGDKTISADYHAIASSDILFDHFTKRGAYVIYSDLLMLRAKAVTAFEYIVRICKYHSDHSRAAMILHKLRTNPRLSREIFFNAYYATTDSLRNFTQTQIMASDVISEVDKENNTIDIHNVGEGMSFDHATGFSVNLVEWATITGISWRLFKDSMFPDDAISTRTLMSEIKSKTDFLHTYECKSCSSFINYFYLSHLISDPFEIWKVISDPKEMKEMKRRGMKAYLEAPDEFTLYEEDE